MRVCIHTNPDTYLRMSLVQGLGVRKLHFNLLFAQHSPTWSVFLLATAGSRPGAYSIPGHALRAADAMSGKSVHNISAIAPLCPADSMKVRTHVGSFFDSQGCCIHPAPAQGTLYPNLTLNRCRSLCLCQSATYCND